MRESDADADEVHVAENPVPLYDVRPDETFASERANHRMGHIYPESWDAAICRPPGVEVVVGARMAGMRCPSPGRIRALVRDPSDIEEWEKGAIREIFQQLEPIECHEFMVTVDASPRELARLMRTSGVRRGIVVQWINQFSSDPDWKPDGMLAIVHGERLAANRERNTSPAYRRRWFDEMCGESGRGSGRIEY